MREILHSMSEGDGASGSGGPPKWGEPTQKTGPAIGSEGMSARGGLPTHNFPAGGSYNEAKIENDLLDRNPDLWLYRRRTVGLLRRYMRFSLETGRLPSMVGREFFRAKVTSYRATTFEDRVIFVRDVEKSLERLEEFDKQLLGRIFLQEHSHEQAACLLNCSRSTLERRLLEALDLLSEDFLRVGLLATATSRRKFSQ
jgi:hypothetical protein